MVNLKKKKKKRNERKKERGVERKRHTLSPTVEYLLFVAAETETHTLVIINRNKSTGLYIPDVLYIKSTACPGIQKATDPFKPAGFLVM